MIRANLNIDIEDIKTEEDWAFLYAQALWLENFRLQRQSQMIASLFASVN